MMSVIGGASWFDKLTMSKAAKPHPELVEG
jgi:hypothetical protein